MFQEIIRRKFPEDEANGLYVAPKLPAVKLGKLLMRDTRVSSPNDVVAMHLNESLFSSSGVYFTRTRCYYGGGEFLLEDVRECVVEGNECTVLVNSIGSVAQHSFKVKNEAVAKVMLKLFQEVAYYDPKAEEIAAVAPAYEGFEGAELDWLRLRDEVMRTIDMLYERFNDGKLSLIDYESKKEEMLSRL